MGRAVDIHSPSPHEPGREITLPGGTGVTTVPSLNVRTNDTRRPGVYPTSDGVTVVYPDQTSRDFAFR